MENKKVIGRPVTGNARNNKFTVRLNDDERKKLQEIADKQKIKPAELVRILIQKEINK